MIVSSIFKLVVGITLIVAVIVFGPLIGIWSLNTLFPILAIPYTWETWLAYFLLLGSITGLRFGVNKK
jgi:hypothetical protein